MLFRSRAITFLTPENGESTVQIALDRRAACLSVVGADGHDIREHRCNLGPSGEGSRSGVGAEIGRDSLLPGRLRLLAASGSMAPRKRHKAAVLDNNDGRVILAGVDHVLMSIYTLGFVEPDARAAVQRVLRTLQAAAEAGKAK